MFPVHGLFHPSCRKKCFTKSKSLQHDTHWSNSFIDQKLKEFPYTLNTVSTGLGPM